MTLEYFLFETTRPECIANNHFGNVTLCLRASGGAMVLGKLPVTGHPTNLE